MVCGAVRSVVYGTCRQDRESCSWLEELQIAVLGTGVFDYLTQDAQKIVGGGWPARLPAQAVPVRVKDKIRKYGIMLIKYML